MPPVWHKNRVFEKEYMASLFASTKKAEIYIAMKNYDAAKREIDLAESTIIQHWPTKKQNPVAICCFTTEGNLIYCADDKIETDFKKKTITVVSRIPLFPAKKHNRRKLCKICREDCKERIQILKEKLANTTPQNKKQTRKGGNTK